MYKAKGEGFSPPVSGYFSWELKVSREVFYAEPKHRKFAELEHDTLDTFVDIFILDSYFMKLYFQLLEQFRRKDDDTNSNVEIKWEENIVSEVLESVLELLHTNILGYIIAIRSRPLVDILVTQLVHMNKKRIISKQVTCEQSDYRWVVPLCYGLLRFIHVGQSDDRNIHDAHGHVKHWLSRLMGNRAKGNLNEYNILNCLSAMYDLKNNENSPSKLNQEDRNMAINSYWNSSSILKEERVFYSWELIPEHLTCEKENEGHLLPRRGNNVSPITQNGTSAKMQLNCLFGSGLGLTPENDIADKFAMEGSSENVLKNKERKLSIFHHLFLKEPQYRLRVVDTSNDSPKSEELSYHSPPGKESNKHFEELFRVRFFLVQYLQVSPFTSLQSYFERIQTEGQLSIQEEMAYEGRRLQSFYTFPSAVSAIRLAQAGLYWTHQHDETACYSCGFRHRNWRSSDNPMEVHRRLSPNCSHVAGTRDRDIPISPVSGSQAMWPRMEMDSTVTSSVSDGPNGTQTNQTTDETDSELMAISTEREKFAMTVQSPSQTDPPLSLRQRSVFSLDFQKAVYPQYRDINSRLMTFKHWPVHFAQRPNILVQGGLFYAGYADCVRCFYCGTGLKTWEPQDDPWVEHIRWRPSCDFIRCIKGEEFVRQTLARIGETRQTETTANGASPQMAMNESPRTGLTAGENGMMKTEAVLKAIEMGFNEEVVKQEALSIINKKGANSLRLEELIEAVLSKPVETSPVTDQQQPTANGCEIQEDQPTAVMNVFTSMDSESYSSQGSSIQTDCVPSTSSLSKNSEVDALRSPSETIVQATVGMVTVCDSTQFKGAGSQSLQGPSLKRGKTRNSQIKEAIDGQLACYQCGQTVHLDGTKSPLEIHAALFPNCRYVIRLLGQRPGSSNKLRERAHSARRRLFSE